MQIDINLENIKNEEGAFNEADVKVIEKLTGKTFKEVAKATADDSDYDFTSEEIGKMSDEEYKKNRDAINKSLKEGRIK